MFNDVEISYKTAISEKYIAKSFNTVIYEYGKGVTLDKDFIDENVIKMLKINGRTFIEEEYND